MYKNMAKRSLAVILAFCMVGNTPDVALLAAGTENISASLEAGEGSAGLGQKEQAPALEETDSSTSKETAGTEDDGSHIQDADTAMEEGTPAKEPVRRAAANSSSGVSALAGAVDISTLTTLGRDDLPTQIQAGFLANGNGFYAGKIIGLSLEDENGPLTQITDEASTENGYKVYVTIINSGRSATVRVAGNGADYTGEIEFNVDLREDLTDSAAHPVTIRYDDYPASNSVPEYYYEGREIVPTVEIGGVDPSNYTVVCREGTNKDVGTAYIDILGKGEYAGEITKQFKIIAANLSIEDQNFFNVRISPAIYNKAKAKAKEADSSQPGITPVFTVKNKNTGDSFETQTEVEKNGNYWEDYLSNTTITGGRQKAYLRLNGTGNCTNSMNYEYEILAASFDPEASKGYSEEDQIKVIFDESGTDTLALDYSGVVREPAITVYQKDPVNGKLEVGTDYTVAYEQSYHTGQRKITITAASGSCYTGSREIFYTIDPYDIQADANVVNEINAFYTNLGLEYEWTGRPIEIDEPDALTQGKMRLEKGTDYEIEYANQVNPGPGRIMVKGIGDCGGVVTIDFKIWKNMADIADSEILYEKEQPYTGKEIKPVPEVKDGGKRLTENEQYTVSYPSDNYIVRGQNREIKLTGKGDYYRGEKTLRFDITRRNLATLKADFRSPQKDNSYTYNGSEYIFGAGDLKVTDASGKEISLGTEFDIEQFKVVDGNAVTPANYRDTGNYQVRLSPKDATADNYEGADLVLPYTIVPKPIVDDDTEYAVQILLNGTETGTLPYAGNTYKDNPALTIRVLDLHRDASGAYSQTQTTGFPLTENVDYTVSYPETWDAGAAVIMIHGKDGGNYTGSRPKNFRINRRALSDAAITLEIEADKNDPEYEYLYTGKPIEPVITKLEIDGRELSADEILDEFMIEMANPENVGVSTGRTFTITGTKNYSGRIDSGTLGVTFKIVAQDINSTDVWVEEIPNWAYEDGVDATPIPEITYNGTKLTSPTDFTLTWHNNDKKDSKDTPLGEQPYVEISGQGNFTGTRIEYFHIRESLEDAQVSGWDNISLPYTSRAIEPWPTSVTLDGNALAPERINAAGESEGDYRVTFKNNINAAKAGAAESPTIIITGINEYGGTLEKEFTITPIMLTLASRGVLKAPLAIRPRPATSVTFTGSFVAPYLTIEYDVKSEDQAATLFTYTLKEGKDYEIVHSANNINVGNSFSLDIAPKGNFVPDLQYGTTVTVAQYNITPKSLNLKEIEIPEITLDPSAPVTYPVTPAITITDTKRMGADSGNEGAFIEEGGTYRLKGPADADTAGYQDYTIQYRNNSMPGTASVTIRGRGNYTDSVTRTFVIPGNLSNAKVTFLNSTKDGTDSGKYWYTGGEITPQIKMETLGDDGSVLKELKRGVDYEMELEEGRTDCGTYSLKLTGKGAYATTGAPRVITFSVEQVPITDTTINIASSIQYQDGANTWPGDDTEDNHDALTIMLGRYQLVQGKDFVLEPENDCWQSIDIVKKKYKLTIRGQGNFSGSIEKEYAIGNNFDVTITLNQSSFTYTGQAILPEITVTDNKTGATLKRRSGAADTQADYDVTYTDNINAGTVTVTVFGLGGEDGYTTRYCGSKKTTFTISKMNLSGVTIGDIEDYTYTGEQVSPKPSVIWEGHYELAEGVDFNYEWPSNGNRNVKDECYVRIVPATADGVSNFTGSGQKSFRITPKNIELEIEGSDDHTYQTAADVTLEDIPDQIYTGNAIVPRLDLHWGENPENQTSLNYVSSAPSSGDYTISWGENNTEIGPVEVTITGQNNYTGTIKAMFEIVKVKLSDVTIAYKEQPEGYNAGEWPWTGKKIEPAVRLTYLSTDGEEIEMNSPGQWGYEVAYGENTRRGTMGGSIRLIESSGLRCEGEKTLRFAIVRRHISDPTIAVSGIEESYELDDIKKNGNPKPTLTFTPDTATKYTLRETIDYSLDYVIPDGIGEGKITVTGTDNFDLAREIKFNVTNDINNYIVETPPPSLTPNRFVYNGSRQRPTVNVDFTDNTIKNPVDPSRPNYVIEWGDDNTDPCIDAGVHQVYIRGVLANGYSGERMLTYTIDPRPISNITFEIDPVEYTGSPIDKETLKVSAVDEGIDRNVQVDPANFEIVELENNRELGTATALIAAAGGNYTDGGQPVRVNFQIVPAKLSDEGDDSYIVCSVESPIEYTGEAVTPQITLTDTRRNEAGGALANGGSGVYQLQEGADKDYTVAFSDDRTYPGRVEVTITGVGHYEGTLNKAFEIYGDFSKDYISIDAIPAQQYIEGQASEPELTVRIGEKTLTLGTDYVVEYENNTNRTEDPANPAKAIIHPAENSFYREDAANPKYATFIISRDISGAQIRLIDEAFTYTGSQITPMVSVIFGNDVLTLNEDYTVSYGNNIETGLGSITITGIGGYDGRTEINFPIIPKSVVRCEFENVEDKVYTGVPTVQELIVTDGERRLEPDRDYTVSYADHTGPGVATLTVSGINNYGGVKTIHYMINMNDLTGLRAQGASDSVLLSWSAVPGAQGYTVYDAQNRAIARTTELSYRHTGLDAVTTYAYKVRPYASSGGTAYYGSFSNTVQATTAIAKPAVKLKASKKKIKVSWNRISGVSGYEIWRSTRRSGGYKKIRTAKKSVITSYTNKRLSRGQKYFYRIRAYKNVDGRKIYGNYSSPKSVKAK